MSQPAKVAIPATAATVLEVQPKVAPAAVVSASVTLLVSVVIVAPDPSWTLTIGCWAKFVPPVAVVLGWVVNASCTAAELTSIVSLTGDVSPPPVAVSVYVPGRAMPQLENVATPEIAAFGFAVQNKLEPD